METNELIASLASDTRPVTSGFALGRLIIALIAGGAVVVALIAIFLGDPLLGIRQTDVMALGVKTGFATSLLLLSLSSLFQSGRPGHDPRTAMAWLPVPVVVLALVASIALASAPPGARHAMIFGTMWQTCLIGVILLSVPVFGLLVWAFRSLAPTDLKRTGMLAGLASGSAAALVYALHCPEMSPAFLLVWYGLGIAIAGVAGRMAGPVLLRW